MIGYFFSALLGAFIMLGVPALLTLGRTSDWNERRIVRARRYRERTR